MELGIKEGQAAAPSLQSPPPTLWEDNAPLLEIPGMQSSFQVCCTNVNEFGFFTLWQYMLGSEGHLITLKYVDAWAWTNHRHCL